jgi:hypothetical protein
MANKNIEQFITTYGPVAQQVSKEINVDPNVLLSQWGLESRWGQSEMAKTHNNVGGIKDFSGHGHEAKDNKTGSVDKYVKFEDPEVFGMYYADQIKRNFPLAVNTGPDIGAFTRGLASGKKGSYFEVTPLEYEKSLASAQSALPSELPFEPSTQAKPADGEGDMVVKDAPPPPPPAPDATGASPGERFLGGAAGTGVGLLATGVKGTVNALDNRAVARATAVENAKIAAQRAAGVVPPAAPAAAPPGGPKPPLGSTIMRQPGAPTTGFNLQPPVGPADAGRMAAGQTGAQVYNYGKAAGLTDIEAGKALDTTKQAGGVHDLGTQRREGLNKVQSMFPGEKYVENPRYGGLLTLDQGVGSGPRESFSMKAPIAPSPEVPQGQPGGLSQLPPRQPVSTAPVAPKAASGLDAVTDMFKGMMRPFATAAKTIGKYALPPLAGLSAGLDVAEMGHEYDKPESQRDYTKMGLKAASAVGGGLSMFPATAPVGVPLAIGATAADMYRDNPDWLRKKMEGLANTPMLDEMTGPTP